MIRGILGIHGVQNLDRLRIGVSSRFFGHIRARICPSPKHNTQTPSEDTSPSIHVTERQVVTGSPQKPKRIETEASEELYSSDGRASQSLTANALKSSVLALKRKNVNDLSLKTRSVTMPRIYVRGLTDNRGRRLEVIKAATNVTFDIQDDSDCSLIVSLHSFSRAEVDAGYALLASMIADFDRSLVNIPVSSSVLRLLIRHKGELMRRLTKDTKTHMVLHNDPQPSITVFSVSPEHTGRCVTRVQTYESNRREIKFPAYLRLGLIGKGGSNKEDIEKKTKTVIFLTVLGSETDTLCALGETRENVDCAITMVEQMIVQLKCSAQYIYQSSREEGLTRTIPIPASLARLFTHNKFEILKTVEKVSLAVVVLEKPLVSGKQALQVQGDVRTMANAIQALAKLIAKHTESCVQIPIPEAYMSGIIGQEGANIRKIMLETQTFMTVEGGKSLVIYGETFKAILAASEAVSLCLARFQNLTARLSVPEGLYRQWVARSNGATLQRIRNTTKTYIFQPPNSKDVPILIYGESRESVHAAKSTIAKIMEAYILSCQTVSFPSAMRSALVGKARSGLVEIMDKSGALLVVDLSDRRVREQLIYVYGLRADDVNGAVALLNEKMAKLKRGEERLRYNDYE
ncbi:hypothetical protein BABINDRAFT_161575 [Babjeviella inositovora NRRL Y-12698]|uniref:K Homology domain-containing protein n=1 Tax=Babjeviella inositovora NRRL Y-12698 TaxID=984486 RepID=A0A1E3QSJ4_9ASCO|nr:uncharacterized protein BABINDRAFT_161575 [Babjeviella inositovora NRRL Y-12698]ODQ79907.1 hypothetical protein BABINDRAFT_161575 [Babjeviella inositovora NRRL Y-12698]